MSATISAPERSLKQRQDALDNANHVRFRRADLKRDVTGRRDSPIRILTEVPDWADTMKVFDLLLALPKWGRVRVNKTLGRVRISPVKTIGGMTERQRLELVEMLQRMGVR